MESQQPYYYPSYPSQYPQFLPQYYYDQQYSVASDNTISEESAILLSNKKKEYSEKNMKNSSKVLSDQISKQQQQLKNNKGRTKWQKKSVPDDQKKMEQPSLKIPEKDMNYSKDQVVKHDVFPRTNNLKNESKKEKRDGKKGFLSGEAFVERENEDIEKKREPVKKNDFHETTVSFIENEGSKKIVATVSKEENTTRDLINVKKGETHTKKR